MHRKTAIRQQWDEGEKKKLGLVSSLPVVKHQLRPEEGGKPSSSYDSGERPRFSDHFVSGRLLGESGPEGSDLPPVIPSVHVTISPGPCDFVLGNRTTSHSISNSCQGPQHETQPYRSHDSQSPDEAKGNFAIKPTRSQCSSQTLNPHAP